MNKAKQVLMAEERKVRSKAFQKRREADQLEQEADELKKQIAKM